MSHVAISLYMFSFYLAAMGILLIAVPNTLLPLLGLPTTEGYWVRVVGMLAGLLAFYYCGCVQGGSLVLARFSVSGRYLAAGFFGVSVVVGWAQPIFLLFALFDASAATWTWIALRQHINSHPQGD